MLSALHRPGLPILERALKYKPGIFADLLGVARVLVRAVGHPIGGRMVAGQTVTGDGTGVGSDSVAADALTSLPLALSINSYSGGSGLAAMRLPAPGRALAACAAGQQDAAHATHNTCADSLEQPGQKTPHAMLRTRTNAVQRRARPTDALQPRAAAARARQAGRGRGAGLPVLRS